MIDTWLEGPAREGKQGVFCGVTNFLPSIYSGGVVLRRECAQYFDFALLMALK